MKLKKYGGAVIAVLLCPFTDGNCMIPASSGFPGRMAARVQQDLSDKTASNNVMGNLRRGLLDKAIESAEGLEVLHIRTFEELELVLGCRELCELVKAVKVSNGVASKSRSTIEAKFPSLQWICVDAEVERLEGRGARVVQAEPPQPPTQVEPAEKPPRRCQVS
ncbi:MAG: hypothetical protein LBC04_01210 [Holosporaceae bacterium]|jgi:hypothetical protein|nr:hypothetical protein [Holosporaceae bacterium]